METTEKLTIDALTKLDNYGHRELKDISKIELTEYATLLQMRRQEVLGLIRELR